MRVWVQRLAGRRWELEVPEAVEVSREGIPEEELGETQTCRAQTTTLHASD